MIKKIIMIVLSSLISLISFSSMAALTTPVSGYDAAKAEETFTQYCTGCHDAHRSLRTLKDEVNWKFAIERMAFQYKLLFGEPIPPKAQTIILEYLIQNAGKQ